MGKLLEVLWSGRSGRGKVVVVVAAVIGIGLIGSAFSSDEKDAKKGGATSSSASTKPVQSADPEPVADPAPVEATPKERVLDAVGSEVEAGGWAGTLEVQDVSFEAGEAQITLTTPEGGLSGASCDDLNEGAKAVWTKVFDEAGWSGGSAVIFRGGLVSTVTGEELPDVNTGIFTIHSDQASQISWSNEDALFNINWSYYRDFCHPALKQ